MNSFKEFLLKNKKAQGVTPLPTETVCFNIFKVSKRRNKWELEVGSVQAIVSTYPFQTGFIIQNRNPKTRFVAIGPFTSSII